MGQNAKKQKRGQILRYLDERLSRMLPAFSRLLADKKKMTTRLRRSQKTRRNRTTLLHHIRCVPASCVHLWVALLSLVVGLFPVQLHALPSGGTVQGGTASIQAGGPGSLNINQQSQRAIIDWINFNIQSGEHVNFDMPSADSVNLSRVTGGNASEIFGKLTSNGQLFLVNPNGILFGQGAQVDVNGLVATTSDISNQDFMAGRYDFNIASPFNSSVVNRGTITVKQGGLAAFVAPGVENSGIINAHLGRVSLASGKTFTLDLYGDQLVNLGLDSMVTEQVIGPNGQPLESLVTNSGQIFADGGRVTLGVNAARDLVDHAINMTGLVQARSVAEKNGEIYLLGGETGTVNVTGTLDASGYGEDETGGVIHVLGDRVFLDDYGFIDISGDAGGGRLLFGGDFQGNGTVQNATDTYIGKDARIWADAVNTGNGGRTIFWADRRNYFLGRVRARGGLLSGDGGFVEISGKETLFFNGYVDTTAANGETGTLLLDPTDITIVEGAIGDNVSLSASGTISFINPDIAPGSSVISEVTLENTLPAANLFLIAANNITFSGFDQGNALDLPQLSGQFARFEAINGNIVFSKPAGGATVGEIKTQGGDLTLKAGGDMILGKLNAGAGTVSIFGSEGGVISLGNATGGLRLDNDELQGITAGNLIIGGSSEQEGRASTINVNGVVTGPSVSGITYLRALSPERPSGFGGLLPAGIINFNGAASSFSNTALTVEALEGINVDVDLLANRNLSLDGDLNNFNDPSDTNPPEGLNLAAGTTLTSSTGSLTLKGTTNGIVGAGALTLNGANGIILDDNITTAGNLTFNNNVTLQGAANSIDAGTNRILFQTNANSLEANNGININSDLDFTGNGTTFSVNADKDGNGVGILTVASGRTLDTMGKALDVRASNLGLAGSINSTSTVSVTSTSSSGVELGTVNAGGFDIDSGELTRITAGVLNVDAGTGSLAVNGLNRNTNLANVGTSVSLQGTFVLFTGADSVFKNVTVNGPSTISTATLSASDGITLNGNATGTHASGLAINADDDNTGAGTFNQQSGTLSSSGNALSITAQDVVLGGSINSGAGTTSIIATQNQAMSLGDATGGFRLDNTELGKITAGGLTIDNSAGAITVNNVNNTLSTTLNGTSLTFNGMNSSFGSLTANGAATIAGVNVSTNNGALNFANAVTLSTGPVQLSTGTGGGDLTLSGTVDGAQDLTLNSGTGNVNLGGVVGGGTALSSLSITANDVSLGGNVTTTGKTTIIASNGGAMSLGDTAVGLHLDTTELGRLMAGSLEFGDSSTTGLTVDNVTNTLATTLNGSTVAFNGTSSSFGTLTVKGTSTIAATGLSANAGIMFEGNVSGTNAAGLTLNGDADSSGGVNDRVFFKTNATSLTSDNGITLNTGLDYSSGGTFAVNADANNDGTGTFNLAAGTLTTNNANLNLTAADVALGGTGINTGGGTTTIVSSNNRNINLGATTGGLDLTDAEIDKITTAGLEFNSGTGSITVDGVTNTLATTLNSSTTTFSGTNSSFGSLTVKGTSTIATDSLSANSGITFEGNVSGTNAAGLTLNGDADSSGGANDRIFLKSNATSLTSNNGITLNTGLDYASGGTFTVNSDTNANGTGTFNQAAGTVTTNNANLNLTAADVTLGGTALTTGTGAMTVADSQSGTIGLGAANCGGAPSCGLSLDGGELDKITTSKLTMGSTTGGAVFVDGVAAAQSATIGTVDLHSGGTATFDNKSTFNNLIVAADDVAINDDLTIANNGTLTLRTSDGGTLGVGTATGDMTLSTAELAFLSAGTLNLGDSTTGNVTLGNVTIDGSRITQGFGVFTGGGLGVQGALVSPVDTTLSSAGAGQGITLNNAGNFFGGTLGLFTGAGGNVAISNLTNNGQTVRFGTSNIGGQFNMTTSRSIQFTGGFSVNGNVDVNSTSGDMTFVDGAFLNAGAGTLRLSMVGDLILGQLISASSSSQAIHLIVGGRVIDGGDVGGEDIIAETGGLLARTGSGFGTQANPIETRIQSLDLTNSGGGDIAFFETDSLDIINLKQEGSGDIFGSFSGTLTGEDNIDILIGRFFIENRETGITLSQILGNTGKDRDALSIERTVNNIVDLEFASGANRFDWDPAEASPAGRVKKSSPYVDDLFSEPFPLVEVQEGNPADGDLAHLENVWHWNQDGEKEIKEADAKKKKTVKKKPAAKKKKKVARKPKKKKNDEESGFLSFFKKAGSVLSFK